MAPGFSKRVVAPEVELAADVDAANSGASGRQQRIERTRADNPVGLEHDVDLGGMREAQSEVRRGEVETVRHRSVRVGARPRVSEQIGLDLQAAGVDRERAFRGVGPIGGQIA